MYPWQNFIVGVLEFAAWPVVAICCALIFKKDISDLLSRIKTLPGGTELSPQVVENQAERKKDFDELYNIKMQDNQNHKKEETSLEQDKENNNG